MLAWRGSEMCGSLEEGGLLGLLVALPCPVCKVHILPGRPEGQPCSDSDVTPASTL